MKIVNLTPHAIHVFDPMMGDSVPPITFEPSGFLARCDEITTPVGWLNGIRTVTKEYGRVIGLPEQSRDTMYIVSMLVRLACPDRLDIFSPGDAIRDSAGKIIGCGNLVQNKGA